MSIESMLIILPEEIEDIVHKYHHQIKFKNVMDELKELSNHIHHTCGVCHEKYFAFSTGVCSHNDCGQSICVNCVRNEVENEYFNYIEDIDEFNNMDAHQTSNFFSNVANNVKCNFCTYVVMTEDEEIPEDWEELDMMDRYGGY